MLDTRKFKVSLIILFVIISFGGSIVVLADQNNEESDTTNLASFNNPTTYFPSNRYTKVDDLAQVNNILDINLDVYKYLTTTAMGEIYLNEEDLSFRIKNSSTDYIWGSTINVDGQRLSTTWKGKVRSAVNISYYNAKNAITEESLFTSANTTITVNSLDDGFNALINFGESKIKLNLIVTFDDKGISVEIPSSSIVETDIFKLATIKVYSFFGAVKGNEIPGYIFVPDGVGALIRYEEIPLGAPNNYYKEIYDRDISYNNIENFTEYSMDGSKIYAPVFGFVHGIKQNAILGIIESGAEFGAINVYQDGRLVDYYTIFPEFNYRKTYKQPINASGGTISILQNYRNDFDIKIRYEMLINDDATYVGMAKKYQSYLVDKNILSQKSNNSSTPLRLEVLLAEKNKGLFFDEKITMTTLNQYKQILDELNQENINNITSVLKGYTSLGYSYSSPLYEGIDGSLGNLDIFDNLDNMYFYADYVKATSKTNNYNSYHDLAKKINEQIYTYYMYNYNSYLLRPEASATIFENSINKLNNKGINNLALDTVGSLLFSDHSNGTTNRNKVIEIYQSMLDSYEHKLALYDSNDYMFKYMDNYFDFPLYSSQYISFDDTVPFLAIALNGYIDLYGSYANFYPSARDELLRLIDFGVFPSFIITNESSHLLLETNLSYIFSSKWEDLKEAVITYYNFANNALKHVKNASIVNREVLTDGVVKITYDNSKFIVVNYTNQDYQLNGDTVVLKKNYLVG